MTTPIRVGVISDTHDLLRPGALEVLQGSEMIVHCGDICDLAVIEELARIAPVRAVRGNNDTGAWADELRESEIIRVGEIAIYVIHDLSQIDIDPKASGVAVILSGHSHKPNISYREGIMYVNPGSAGPRRFKLPVCLAELIIDGSAVFPRIVELESGGHG
jgi:putative phosphoesterase